MRDLIIIFGSSTLLPPPPPPPPHHHSSITTHKPHHRYLPPKPSLSSSTSSSSSSRAPLLKFLRQDQTPLSYFSNIASNLARDGKFESFLMLAETVLVSGTEPSQLVASLRIKSVSAGFSELIKKNGGVESVIGVLGKLKKLGFNPAELFDKKAKELIANECRALVKGRRLKQVVDLMEILAGLSFPVKEFVKPHEIINLCVEKRDPHMAVRYVCILPHAHILFSKIIYEFGKKGDLGSSLIAFETSKCNSDSPNMYSWRTIIDVCGRCGDFLKSRSIYEELLAQKVVPNAYVFNSLMNVNAHDLNYTLHVYNQMQDLHVAADLASYNILLKACCLAGRVDLAQNFYEEVRHRASMRELKLDVITYSTIIKVFADSKMWEMALRIKEDMLSAGVTPNVVTWSSLISACSHAGLVELATQAFDKMLLAGCDPNSQCCNSLLHAYVEARQYDRAFRIFQSWKENGLRGTYTTKSETKTDGQVCIDTEDSSGNNYTNLHTNPTRLSFAKMVPFTPTTATYNILMKCCGTDYFHAKALMVEMKMAGLFPNHITWSTLINICGSSGNIEASVRALKDMHHNGIKPDVIAYTAAIKACVNNKSLKMAFSLFEEMKKYQLKPNLVTYNTLLRARSRYGSLQEVQQCLAIYQDMRRAGYNPNDYFLKELIAEWCEGVLQNNNQHQDILGNASCSQMDGGKPPSLLLEKVAAHLQRDNAQNLAIDLRGLTKVEARIVVLAVLRMIKEDYNIGRPFQDDIVIILGVKKEAVGPANRVSEVQDAVVKLLNEELGLSVVSVGSGMPVMRSTPRTPLDPGHNSICSRKNELPADFESRRPAALQRLRVTRKSLYLWLRKGAGIIR